jgi:putative NADH-flavin reductase
MTSDSLAEPVESKVTRLLAIGLAPSAVIEEMAKVIDGPFAMEDFREALAAVAALVKETSLLPHFKDGFQGRPL